MDANELTANALALAASGKGILAADESTPTITKRFKTIDLPSTEENRRAYREMLFTTPGLGDSISGVILFDETIRQRARDGRTFVKVLQEQGIVPGIKVDKGAKALANFPGEKITEGLDGLRERFKEYFDLGARFSKWRAVITIGERTPSHACISSNAHALACFAALSQETGWRRSSSQRFSWMVAILSSVARRSPKKLCGLCSSNLSSIALYSNRCYSSPTWSLRGKTVRSKRA